LHKVSSVADYDKTVSVRKVSSVTTLFINIIPGVREVVGCV
jgi:hypothetical protein